MPSYQPRYAGRWPSRCGSLIRSSHAHASVLQSWDHLDHLGDFTVHVSWLIAEGLVVKIGVHVPLLGQKRKDLVGAPSGPVMGGKGHIDFWAKSSMASAKYRDHIRGSRTWAPRRVRRSCMLWVAFSAIHKARLSGKQKFISAGHSVPGVVWNMIRTPSTTSSWPVSVMSSVGAMRPGVPVDPPAARPIPKVPVADFGSPGAA